jgi:mannose-6-phosphate isomerase-like protein (cupin superfamily)
MKPFAAFLLVTTAVLAQNAAPKPIVAPLVCAESDCPLLQGAPQTTGMRSGFVRLKPGATVGEHTTGANEETLVILRGAGELLIDGQPARPFTAPAYAYVPPATRHNVRATGSATLEYVYVVAPAKAER